MTSTVHMRQRDGVATLTLDNPPLNLLTMQLREQLAQQATRLRDDPACRAVVITGTGKTFSAGSDISEFPPGATAGTERAKQEHALFTVIEQLPQPTIATLRGHVLGGGLELALACDLRVADETARLGLPEVNLGLLPCGGGTQRLPRLIGAAKAKMMLLTGEYIDVTRAEQYGLVDRVTPADEAGAAAQQLAARIAAAPPATTRAIKTAVARGLSEGMATGLALEEQLVGPLFASAETQHAVRCFLAR